MLESSIPHSNASHVHSAQAANLYERTVQALARLAQRDPEAGVSNAQGNAQARSEYAAKQATAIDLALSCIRRAPCAEHAALMSLSPACCTCGMHGDQSAAN